MVVPEAKHAMCLHMMQGWATYVWSPKRNSGRLIRISFLPQPICVNGCRCLSKHTCTNDLPCSFSFFSQTTRTEHITKIGSLMACQNDTKVLSMLIIVMSILTVSGSRTVSINVALRCNTKRLLASRSTKKLHEIVNDKLFRGSRPEAHWPVILVLCIFFLFMTIILVWRGL